MKNFEKILLVTVFFCLLPVANLFALSKEATEAIEAMRARLRLLENNEEQTISNNVSSSDEYVPGRELSAVLARIKRERFASENRLRQHNHKQQEEIKVKEPESVSETVQVEPQEEDRNYPIVAVDEPDTKDSISKDKDKEGISVLALPSEDTPNKEAVVASEPKNKDEQDELIIIEAMEADDSEAWSIPINNKEQAKKQKIEASSNNKSAKKDEYVTGQLLQQSIRRIRHSQRRNTPASSELDSAIEAYERRLAQKQAAKNSKDIISSANEEIDELFNNADKRASLADRDSSNPQKDNSDDNQIDDEKFNDYISKYDFKMPENYRIIVE